MEPEELIHIRKVIESSKAALIKKDALKLKELSSQMTHVSSIHQHRGLIAISVIVYTLSKMIERKDYEKFKNWDNFVKKFNSELGKAVSALKRKDMAEYDRNIIEARKTLETISKIQKSYVEEIIVKASINKASKLYEHGISLEQTAKLLGITQWDLSEYAGRTKIPDVKQNITINTQTRAKMALEFFA